MPQTMTYLLLKSVHETAKAVDVRRIYSLRHGLRLLDFQDERCAHIGRRVHTDRACAVRPP